MSAANLSLDTRWSSCNCKNQNHSHSRGCRRLRSDRGRLCNGIHVQDTDGPERQNKPRDQAVHRGSPGSAPKQFFELWRRHSWTREIFPRFKHSIQLAPVVSRSLAVPSTNTYGCHSLASLISGRMTDEAITQNCKSWQIHNRRNDSSNISE